MLRYSCKDSKEDVYNKIQITNKKSSLALLQKERKMKMKKEKSLYWALLVVALALVAGIGVTFAWFTNQAGRQGELVTTGTLQIQYEQKSTLTVNNLKPATTAQVLEAFNSTNNKCIYVNDLLGGVTTEQICAYNTFTISNIGSLTAYVDVNLTNITNTYQNLRYALFETVPPTLTGQSLTGVTSLANDVQILKDMDKTYTLLVWLDQSATTATDQNKSYTAKITANAITSNN